MKNTLNIKYKIIVGNLQNVKYSTDSKDLSKISVKFYKNADAQKLQIIVENKGKSGIYL